MSIKGFFFWKFGNSKSHKYPHFFLFFFVLGFVLRFWFQPTCPPKPKKRTFWSGVTYTIYTHNSKFQWELPYTIPQWRSILIRSHIPLVNFSHYVKSWYFHKMLPTLQSTKSSNFGNLLFDFDLRNIILYIERL